MLSAALSISYQISVYKFAQSRTAYKLYKIFFEEMCFVFTIFISGSIDLPVNSDPVTRAELRRTRLDLIRREYEVNTPLPHVYTVW